MNRVLLAASMAALLLAGCETAPAQSPARDTAPVQSQRVEVTRDEGGAPEKCSPQSVGDLVVRFFDAVNREDVAAISGFFTEDFEWFSITEGNPRNGGRHFAGYDHADLNRYFARRVQQDERMYLLEIDVQYESARDLGHVAYNLHRTADDISGYGPDAGGKGAIDCSTGLIHVWSFGQAEGSMFVGELCPGEATPTKVALACTR